MCKRHVNWQPQCSEDGPQRKRLLLVHRRWLWLGLVPAGALAVALTAGRQQLAFPIDHSVELRVLNVSLGTNHFLSREPRWKQMARHLLPGAWEKALGPFQGETRATRHPSLVVWVGEFYRHNGSRGPGTFSTPEAVFRDGHVAPGRTVHARSGSQNARLEFQSFQRDAQNVPLRVRHGTNVVAFTVRNPRPVQVAQWTSQPLPQTNRLSQTEVVLRQLSLAGMADASPAVRGRATSGARAGWFEWRVTFFDPSGNWTDGGWRSSVGDARLDYSGLPPNSSAWKVVVEGREYVSAGFVAVLDQTTTHQVLAPNHRARDFGVTFLMVAGPGGYEINDGIVTRRAVTANLQRPSLRIASDNGAVLETPTLGVFCISATRPLRARLRERIGADDGRLFYATTSTNVMAGTGESIASFFGCRALPANATNIEVELIAPAGPAEFFVKPIR